MNPRERGLNGPRKLAASGLLFVTGALAACGGNPTPTETQRPTITPNETPTPTTIVTPSQSPEVTPSPTIEVTPTPTVLATPEATPVPIADLITEIITKAKKEGWKNVSKQDVLDSIDATYANDPEAAAFINPITNKLHKELVYNNWEFCASDTDKTAEREDCGTLEGIMYYGGYTVDSNKAWLGPMSNVIYYAHETLGAQDFQSFLAIASSQQNPFN